MAKKIEIRIGSETYSGRTKTEATQAALDHLAALFPNEARNNGWGSWAPEIIRVGNMTGVVYKDCAGFWSYRMQWEDGKLGSTHSGEWTRQIAEYHCRRHLAQASYQPGFPAESMAVIHAEDSEGKADHARWLKFQAEYLAARADGLNPDDARIRAYGSAL